MRRWLVLIGACTMGFLFPFILDRCYGVAGVPASKPDTNSLRQHRYSVQSTRGSISNPRTAAIWNRRQRTPVPAQRCTFAISPIREMVGAAGAQGSISVTPSAPTCTWAVTETLDWIRIESGAVGVGTGTVTYAVSSHKGPFIRVGSITVAGQTFTVIQKGRQDAATTGSVAGREGWE